VLERNQCDSVTNVKLVSLHLQLHAF
jgi:hypothetical protein